MNVQCIMWLDSIVVRVFDLGSAGSGLSPGYRIAR